VGLPYSPRFFFMSSDNEVLVWWGVITMAFVSLVISAMKERLKLVVN
jgi:hypothetical protein